MTPLKAERKVTKKGSLEFDVYSNNKKGQETIKDGNVFLSYHEKFGAIFQKKKNRYKTIKFLQETNKKANRKNRSNKII